MRAVLVSDVRASLSRPDFSIEGWAKEMSVSAERAEHLIGVAKKDAVKDEAILLLDPESEKAFLKN